MSGSDAFDTHCLLLSYTSGSQLLIFHVSLLFMQLEERGRLECRQIKAEADRYGNMPCRTRLFMSVYVLMHHRTAAHQAYLLWTKNTLHLLVT